MMIRRTIAVILGFILSVGILSACTSAEVTATDPTQDPASVTEEVAAQDAVVDPQDAPPVVQNPMLPVSELDIDTSRFTSPVTVAGWEMIMNVGPDAVEAPYAVVGLVLSDQDWKEFSLQAGFDSNVTFDQVQLDYYTANSLYDINQLADEIIEYQEERGELAVDIHEVETYWSIVVL